METITIKSKVYQNAANHDVLRWITSDRRTVLDIGCGAGDLARELRARGHIVDGVTISLEEQERAGQFCRSVHVWDVEQGLPTSVSGPYDAVVASHVLEHLRYPEPLLAAIRHVMKPGGRLVVALPNMLHWRNRWRLVCGKIEYEYQGLMDATHFKWYTLTSARELLERHNYIVEQSYATGYLPLSLFGRCLTNSARRKIDALACHVLPGLLGTQLLYICSAQTRLSEGQPSE